MDANLVQRLALVVDPPDDDFDPDVQPETGEQYLQKVIYERQKCPAVVVVNPNPKRRSHQPTGSGIVPGDGVKNCAHQTLIPTKEWEQLQNEKFASLRDTITGYRDSSHYQENLQRTQIFLNFENRRQLHEYCANNQPFVRILLSIPQRNLEVLLEYLFEWLQEALQPANNDWIMQWIYAILACIITPLEPYVHSILRDIAKTCIAVRNELAAEDEHKVLPLNLLICIIAKNFHQLDLSDNVL